MRSPSARASRLTALGWLLAKECRELLASRAWWVMLAVIGPLTGVAYISAVRTYAELSGLNGTASGVGEAFSPLVGVWGPTFSALELAAVFLLPFVAIRVFGGDLFTGAAKIEMQGPLSPGARVAMKTAALAAGWAVASVPIAIALLLWRAYGGWIHAPELGAAFAGHLLNASITLGFAAAMATIAEHPSTAAILTLGATVGTWMVDFMAAIHGGAWQRVSGYMPASMVSEFQHGLIRLSSVLVALIIVCAELAIAAVWLRIGRTTKRRLLETVAVLVIAAGLGAFAAAARASWDLSEARINSFSGADEDLLARLPGPLDIEIHLAPEDPRRVDLERGVLGKLDRTVPALTVRYAAATSVGLFEQTREDYGEVWYALGGRRIMDRGTDPDSVLDTIYELAGISPPPARAAPSVYRGHPLASPPRGAGFVFYAAWPALVAAAMGVSRWRETWSYGKSQAPQLSRSS